MERTSKTGASSNKPASKTHAKIAVASSSRSVHRTPGPIIASTKASKLFKPIAPKPVPITDSSVAISTVSAKTNLVPKGHGHQHQHEMLSRRKKIERKKEEQQKLHKSRIHRTVNYLAKKTHFEPDAIKSLLEMFRALSAVSPMDRQRFRQLLHKSFGMNSNIMLDRLFMAFDGDNQGTVTETEWVMGLSVMLRGTFDEKIRFTYEVYDVNGDNSIGRDEINTCLKGCFKPVAAVPNDDEEDFEEFEKEIVDIAMRKLDVDRDGVVQIGDFYQAAYSDPLLLQALGPCLPSIKATADFLALLEFNYQTFCNGLSVPGDIGWDHHRSKGQKIGIHFHHHQHVPQNMESVFDRKKVTTFFSKRNKED